MRTPIAGWSDHHLLLQPHQPPSLSLPMPLTALPQSVNVGRPMTLISRDKENQHKKTKIIATSASQPRLRRRRRVHSTQLPPPASRVAHGVAVAHAAMRRLKRQGRKQRDQPHASHLPPQSSNSESEPMSIELIDTPEPSTSQQPQQQEQAIKPAVSGLKYNFPRFLPRYPMPAIKAEALAAIDEQLRDIPIQFILDDILINLAPVYVSSIRWRLSSDLTCDFVASSVDSLPCLLKRLMSVFKPAPTVLHYSCETWKARFDCRRTSWVLLIRHARSFNSSRCMTSFSLLIVPTYPIFMRPRFHSRWRLMAMGP